jgi:S-DNA-T family DNA segregation ATPase FtsK/SpoIIIE
MASWHALRRAGSTSAATGRCSCWSTTGAALVREQPELEAEITELTGLGLHYGVHPRPHRQPDGPGSARAYRENLGGRLELRLNDPLESEVGRRAAASLPDLPGRGLTPRDSSSRSPCPARPAPSSTVPFPVATARSPRHYACSPPWWGSRPWRRAGPEGSAVGLGSVRGGARRTHHRPPSARACPSPSRSTGWRWCNSTCSRRSPHLLSLATSGAGSRVCCGSSPTAWPRGHPPDEVALVIVDPRRGLLDLTALPNLVGYAYSTTTVTQAVDQLRREFEERSRRVRAPARAVDARSCARRGQPRRPAKRRTRSFAADGAPTMSCWWTTTISCRGPARSPLLPLLDLLGLGRELGFHLVLTRRVAGAARAAFEPVVQRLRELGGSGLVMSGDPGEGPLLGGQRAAALPPGRGFLVRPPAPPTLVQVAYRPPPATSRPAGGRGAWGG